MPHRVITMAAALAMLATALLGHAQAAFTGMPMQSALELQRIRLDAPALPPLAHVRFCLQYPRDCHRSPIIFRSGRVKLSLSRARELMAVNARVNAAIRPEQDASGVANERWHLAPRSGSCHDYAVTKRHELMARGWPARSLLLAEVVTSWGEHHLVLVVRTRRVDLVLDNLAADIRPWTEANYKWVRIATPDNPMFWAKVADRTKPAAGGPVDASGRFGVLGRAVGLANSPASARKRRDVAGCPALLRCRVELGKHSLRDRVADVGHQALVVGDVDL